MSALTAAERLAFESLGYLTIEGALAPAELDTVRRAADEAEPSEPSCCSAASQRCWAWTRVFHRIRC
jgi:hypothetical protein